MTIDCMVNEMRPGNGAQYSQGHLEPRCQLWGLLSADKRQALPFLGLKFPQL